MLRIDSLWELLDLDEEIDSPYRGYQTVSGFVMTELEGIPLEGESFYWRDLRFEVVDMDGRRIDKVLVSRVLPNESSEHEGASGDLQDEGD